MLHSPVLGDNPGVTRKGYFDGVWKSFAHDHCLHQPQNIAGTTYRQFSVHCLVHAVRKRKRNSNRNKVRFRFRFRSTIRDPVGDSLNSDPKLHVAPAPYVGQDGPISAVNVDRVGAAAAPNRNQAHAAY